MLRRNLRTVHFDFSRSSLVDVVVVGDGVWVFFGGGLYRVCFAVLIIWSSVSSTERGTEVSLS